jgi:hypothetical protein
VRRKRRIWVKLKRRKMKFSNEESAPEINLTKIPTAITRHERNYPVRSSKIFLQRFFRQGWENRRDAARPPRCIQELESDRRPVGFQVPAMYGAGRSRQDQDSMDFGDS